MPSILADIHTLDQHLSTYLRKPERYRPRQCPHCGKGGLWLHGVYYRKAQCEGQGRPTPIQRFLCPGCHTTCSTLPAYLPPRRWYFWLAQQIALWLLVQGASLMQAWQQLCEQLPQAPSLATIHRWWRHLRQQFPTHRVHLCNHFPGLPYEAHCAAFWRAVLSRGPLSHAMAALHRAGQPIP